MWDGASSGQKSGVWRYRQKSSVVPSAASLASTRAGQSSAVMSQNGTCSCGPSLWGAFVVLIAAQAARYPAGSG